MFRIRKRLCLSLFCTARSVKIRAQLCWQLSTDAHLGCSARQREVLAVPLPQRQLLCFPEVAIRAIDPRLYTDRKRRIKMRDTKTLNLGWIFLGTLAVSLSLFLASPIRAAGSNGFNAICKGTVPPGISCSGAFVDATAVTAGSDFCATVNNALAALPSSSGGVVDARGLATPATCAANLYVGITNPSIVLLPPGTITISATWAIPNKSQLIGEGRDATTIKAASGFSPADMIDMGNTTLCPVQCFGVKIADLTVAVNGTGANGIVDVNAAEGSEVDGVTISGVVATGLIIQQNHSGPYNNLYILGAGSAGSATACVKITGNSTRGIHSITCIGNGSPNAGVYLDGSNNTIEDGHFEGVQDGIAVGDSTAVSADVILNITAAGGGTGSGAVHNAVHICGGATVSLPCQVGSSVTDLSLLGIGAVGSNTPNMVKDDETNTTIPAPGASIFGYVGAYMLGEPIGSGYSRFVTNTSGSSTLITPTWGVGGSVPGSSCGNQNGSFFSNTSGTTGGKDTLYVCVAGSWIPII
jgi:Pectate lyase superfamily protein